MRETERRIKAYKALLPRMKEKVIAALSLLVVAAVMMTSTTYAWIVLSTNPEVKGLQTTIAANGNLEIALASGETISAPANSQVGDGALELLQKNITWGNLVNLGDPAYGLDNITLRPAQLNTNDLLGSPLYAAKYGEDGRVEELMSDFAYTYFDRDGGVFSPDEQFKKYGVRAVSSVTYGFSQGRDTALADAVTAAKAAVGTAQSNLQLLAVDPALQSLVGLMGDYVAAQIQEELGGGTEPLINVSIDTVQDIYNLMVKLRTNMVLSADALAAIYNMEMLRRSDTAYVAANKFTGTEILTGDWNAVKAKMNAKNSKGETLVQAEKLTYVEQLRTDYVTMCNDIDYMTTCLNRNDIYYRNVNGTTYLTVEDVLNRIVVTNSVTIDGTRITNIGTNNYQNFMGKDKKIVIHEGILQRMDRFTGAEVLSDTLTVKVSVTVMFIPINVDASGKATTSARDNPQDYVLPTEIKRAIAGDTSYKGDTIQAADTYGLVLDFWVRTNAANSQLILQGSPVYETRDEAVVVQINGESKALYTITYKPKGAPEAQSYTAYQSGTDYYAYDQASGTPGELICAQSAAESVTPITHSVQYVVGYNGVNRVWDDTDDVYLDDNSTTMGSGSCYVFYPKSADDQEKSLQLLKSFTVAFIDRYGNKLGEAVMDVDNVYEQTGKVTVPLVCSISNKSTTDAEGNPIYYIADLEQNTATFITALLYLDGTNLSNDQVLAANDIQGHLNIQFGTTADLGAMNDPALREEKCFVTASMEAPDVVTLSDFYDITRGETTFKGYTKTIKVNVDGNDPKAVTAYFQREINSTQGVRQGRIDFVKQADGSWLGEYDFTTAGNYILREVLLDGVNYELDQEPLTFKVEGYTISNLMFTNGVVNGKTYMTTERHFDVDLSLAFATSDFEPAVIKGAFIHQETGNRTTVYFTRKAAGQWTGSASFTTSGEYRLERLEFDNNSTGLTEDQMLSVNLYLGITASVYTGNTNININEQTDVEMSMLIRDDSGEILRGLTDVQLEYRKQGSSITEEGLYQSMVYDGSAHMYRGTFHLSGEGIYTFYRANIKVSGANNYLNTVTTAPVITAINPSPVAYVERTLLGQETFSMDSDASFSITMAKIGTGGTLTTADAVAMDAVLKRAGDDTLYYVRGVNNGGTITFTLPEVGEDGQTGTWSLLGVYMTNVDKFSDVAGDNEYVKYRLPNIYYPGSDTDPALDEGNPAYATDDKPMYQVSEDYYAANWWYWPIEDLTNEENGETVDNAYMTVTENFDITFVQPGNVQDLGKDNNGNVTGLFGTKHTPGVVQMQILAGGKGLSEYGLSLQSAKIIYGYDKTRLETYNGSQLLNKYGGNYIIGSASDINTMLSVSGTTEIVYNASLIPVDADGTQYSFTTTNSEVNVAGVYAPVAYEIIVTDGKTSRPLTVNLTKEQVSTFTVWSKKPTVTVNSVSPAPGTEIIVNSASNPATTGDFTAMTGDFNYKSTYSATAYIYYTEEWLITTYYNGYLPQVSLKLDSIGNFTEAKMAFANSANSSYNREYTFKPTAKTPSQSIGGIVNKTGTDTEIYPAGKQVVDALYVTDTSGVVVTFTLDNAITINQPQYPYQATYTSTTTNGVSLPTTPSSTFAVPDENGVFTITLPGTQTWTTNGEQKVGGNWELKSDVTDYVYRTWSTSGCDSKTYYVGYDRRTVIEESYGTTTTWTNNYEIIGWKIGSKTYAPGEKVVITSNQTITAVVSCVKTNEISVEEKMRRTNITYTETMSQKESLDSKYTINIGTGSTAPSNIVDKIESIN